MQLNAKNLGCPLFGPELKLQAASNTSLLDQIRSELRHSLFARKYFNNIHYNILVQNMDSCKETSRNKLYCILKIISSNFFKRKLELTLDHGEHKCCDFPTSH